MGTTKAPSVAKVETDEDDAAEAAGENFPDEYEGDAEEEETVPLYWKGNVRVDTIVYAPVTADFLVQQKNSCLYLSHIDLRLPQGQVLLNDTLNMVVSNLFIILL